ncbi:phosphate ABC transporter permease PstA [Vallitaleaceae bacterium 9-2]
MKSYYEKLHTYNTKPKRILNRLFYFLLLIMMMFSVFVLGVLLYTVIRDSWGWFDWQFITSMPSRKAENAGIYSALLGSIWTIGLTALFSIPIGAGTAVYLEEYSDQTSRLNKFIQLNISNLAGIPSIVYGMLGLTVFVRMLSFDRSILSGALTLTLLILPVIIVSSQEAIRSVPKNLKEASFAVGMTRWQTITGVVLPFSIPGILTGSILAISRAMGEAAPLIMVGAAGYVAFKPESIFDAFTTLPIQIFNWTSRPQEEFQHIAAAGILLLLIFLLVSNAIAIILRNKYQNRID